MIGFCRPKRCMGRTECPDLRDYKRAWVGKGKPAARAKWRSSPSAYRSVLENRLTPPTLSETRFFANLTFRDLATPLDSLT